MARERKIEQWKNGILISQFESIQKAAQALKIPKSDICNTLKGNYKSAGGFIFKYCEDIIEGEVWKNHRLGYLVSNLGRVQALNGVRSYGCVTRLKYMRIQLGSQKHFVHRLVLEAFVGECAEGMECDHIDRNRSNNRLENLRWTTQKYNRGRKRVRTIKSDAE